MSSARDVNPRTSANSTPISISTPPIGAFSKHVLQSVGFFRDGPNPKRTITRPPAPPNGAWHRRQRGSEGSLRITEMNARGR